MIIWHSIETKHCRPENHIVMQTPPGGPTFPPQTKKIRPWIFHNISEGLITRRGNNQNRYLQSSYFYKNQILVWKYFSSCCLSFLINDSLKRKIFLASVKFELLHAWCMCAHWEIIKAQAFVPKCLRCVGNNFAV